MTVHTPETLAERWRCSSRHVRNLINRGELRSFRLGKLFRIRDEAVEEYECQNQKSTQSDGAGENLSSSTRTPAERAAVTALAPLTRARLSSLRQRSSLS